MEIDPEKIRHLSYFLTEKFDGITLDGINVLENRVLMENYFSARTNYADFRITEPWENIKYL